MENEDAYEANNMNNVVFGAKKTESKKEDNPKKTKFSAEGIVGFAMSIATFYMGVISFVIFIFGLAYESDFVEILGFCFMAGSLISSVAALTLCNIGAKKAENRVFCFIGRGISIFAICWIALMIISSGVLLGIGFTSEDLGTYL